MSENQLAEPFTMFKDPVERPSYLRQEPIGYQFYLNFRDVNEC